MLISGEGLGFAELPLGAMIGTGSWRRRAQLLHVRPDLEMRDIRGNVDTRIRKLEDGEYDAIVLAHAGLLRLGLGERVTEYLQPDVMLPAVGQGALAIEIRSADSATRACGRTVGLFRLAAGRAGGTRPIGGPRGRMPGPGGDVGPVAIRWAIAVGCRRAQPGREAPHRRLGSGSPRRLPASGDRRGRSTQRPGSAGSHCPV